MLRSLPLALCLGLTLGCSHGRPYYRDADIRGHAASIDRVDHRLFLIGDAGEPSALGEPVLEILARRVREAPERSSVVFLGDNIYTRGMPPADGDPERRADAERRLDAQIAVVAGTPAAAVFIPGNHDWDMSGDGGWQSILDQASYLDEHRAATGDQVSMLPRGGCPGPTALALGRALSLIAIDTQWWLHEGSKPSSDHDPTGCETTSEPGFESALVNVLEGAALEGRAAVVAAHHPMATRGPHGGFATWTTHLFPITEGHGYVPVVVEWIPLPGLGTAAALWRRYASPSAQDESNGRNREMRESLRDAMAEAARRDAAPRIVAGGHDHSLQIFEGGEVAELFVVSGLGSSAKGTRVGHDDATLFAHANRSHPGFVQLDAMVDASVRLSVVEVAGDGAEGDAQRLGVEVYSRWLTRPQQGEGR